MHIRTVEVTRILNPTSIDLGEYVINPYKGCLFGCLYCYVRYNKVTAREERPWGEYLDVRVNVPELLRKELEKKRPRRVLLGSTTECFQVLESRHAIMGEILTILNEAKVRYSILSRSPHILEYIPFLNKGWCESIYFTVNAFPDNLKAEVEPRSPAFEKRIAAVLGLYAAGISVIPYCSPVLPYVSDIRFLVSRLEKLPRIEGEGLNFNVGNIEKIIEAIGRAFPHLRELYERMRQDYREYNRVWNSVKEEFDGLGRANRKEYSLYVHGLRSFFENRYRE